MKKLFTLLFIIPLIASAQCPELIGKPVNNSRAFYSKVAKELHTDIRDSLLFGDRFEYRDELGLKFKIVTAEDKVRSLYIEGSKEQIQTVVSWIEKQFASCQVAKEGQWMKYPEGIIVWKDETSKKRSLYISAK